MARYVLAEEVPAAVARELSSYSPLTQQLLYNRGITTAPDAAAFLAPDYQAHRHDPFLMPGMEAAVSRVLRAVAEGERVTVFADYDCDGIPAGVVLHDFFTAIGFTNFDTYIPHRHFEGFGLSATAVETIAKRGSTLIVTVDCGTSNIEAVAVARQLGVDVIITDHHEPAHELPDAVAIVNPKVGAGYPFPHLCGAGVTFKLVEALIARGGFSLTPGFEKWWLDMVGVATVADMVPLVGENRVFATFGLQVLRKSRRPGLQQLLRAVRAEQRFLTEDDIGFTIGPRINAASRMDTPEDAFTMLAETDESAAGARVRHLEALNNERRGAVAAMSKELHGRLKKIESLPSVLVFGNPEWRPALVGLTAGKLAEEYRRPAFVWGRDGNGTIKGSARSDGRVSVVSLMHEAAPSFHEYGGHHFSGGFSVREESVHTLGATLNDAFTTLGAMATIDEETVVDAVLTFAELTDHLMSEVFALGPFGTGNAKPLFRFDGVTPTRVDAFGKTKEHTKLVFETPRGLLEAIQFFKRPEQFAVVPEAGRPLSLVVHIEESHFMGRQQRRLRIVDILA